MSEAMALEQLTASLAEMQGWLTGTRIPALSKLDARGMPKTGEQMGDLDVVGMKPDPSSPRLLVAECKGYGGAEEYENWLKPFRLNELAYLVDMATTNTARLGHPTWDAEFARKDYKPDEVWIIFSGKFELASNPKSWRGEKYEYAAFHQKLARRIGDDWKGKSKTTQDESRWLAAAEDILSASYKVTVKLKPVHLLLDELLRAVPTDMRVRRKRYPDTALEMVRWIHRAVRFGPLDLASIGHEYRTRNYSAVVKPDADGQNT